MQRSPKRAQQIVGFDALYKDLNAGTLPAFALIVPNQCNDMHGLDPTDYSGASTSLPKGCDHHDLAALIRRGDDVAGRLVDSIQHTAAWSSSKNVAIVITFDEADGQDKQGCCGVQPSSTANFGGGRIPTIVLTNHGPRSIADSTPYSHYSLLRTIEDAFGIHEYLGHANDAESGGVRPMVPLFAR